MRTYLNIDVTWIGELYAVTVLNKFGFVLEAAHTQQAIPATPGDRPRDDLFVQVRPPKDFKRLLPRLVAALGGESIVMTRVPDPAPPERKWLITKDGIHPFTLNA